MDAKIVFWIGFLSTCMISTSVDSIDPYYITRAKMTAPKHTQRIFRATSKKCCHIGKKTARKRLKCVVPTPTDPSSNSVKETFRSKASRRNVQNFQGKINQCRTGPFASMFTKCCYMRETLYKEIRKCRTIHRRRAYRKKCKRDVRRRYS